MAKRTPADRTDAAAVRRATIAHGSANTASKPARVHAASPTTVPAGEVRLSLRGAQRAVTRARLMDGAMEVFATTTYTAATVDEIAVAAGVGRATFYLHFRGKLDLLQAIVLEAAPEIFAYYERADPAFAAGDTVAVEAWVRDALSYFEQHRTLIFVLDEVLATARADAASVFSSEVDFGDHMPLLMSKWPPERRSEASARIRLMALMLNRAWLLWQSEDYSTGLDHDDAVKMLADIWMKALIPPASVPVKGFRKDA